MGGKTTHGGCPERGKRGRSAFIFTTDAFLVLPLIILAISTFISFSVTLRENTIQQEYALTLARDSLNYMSDVTLTGVGLGGGNVTVMDSVISRVLAGDLSGANSTVATTLDRYVPASAAYILEYKDASSGDWIALRQAGNAAKLQNPKVQVSEMRIITSLTQPSINYSANCPQDIICTSPSTRYAAGQVAGPLLLRIRVFA